MNKSSPGKILKSFLIQVDKFAPNKLKSQLTEQRRLKIIKSVPNHWSKTLMVDVASVYPSSLATQVAFEQSQAQLKKTGIDVRTHRISANEAMIVASDTVKGGNY